MDTTKESRRRRLSRRRFLQGAGTTVVASALAGGGVLRLLSRAEAQGEMDEELARRQWAMIIDLRRCDGCRVCVRACQKMHYLPEEQEWIKVYEMEDTTGGTHYMPRLCMQCEKAPCLRVCPVYATYKVPDGVIVVDQDMCIGCRMCMAACPYDARYFNWNDPPPAPRTLDGPTPEWPIPQQRGTVGKCLFCIHNTRFGKLPACVEFCPMKAIYIGDLKADLATNGVELELLSRFLKDNHAVRYKEDLGTRPRVWYILGHGQNWNEVWS